MINLLLFCLHISFLVISVRCQTEYLRKLNLPPSHLPLHLQKYKSIKDLCLDEDCEYKKYMKESSVCWGYEEDCSLSNQYSNASCPGDHKGWVTSKKEQMETFNLQADFGHIAEKRQSLKEYCSPIDDSHSSRLECNDHLLFCRGENLFLDLRSLATRKTPIRYHMDVLKPGDIKGNCRLNSELLSRNTDMLSPLQSWGPELRHFQSTGERADDWQCDVWYDTPVIITKIDAAVSLYHHFCDFFNLYASQHLNNTCAEAFSKDVKVIIWESYPYRSSFKQAWDAFTDHPLQTLSDVAGKRLCFRQVMFPLLPRMIFGLYYNTPIIWGCEKSGLFHAFNRHFLHRMGVPTRDGDPNREREGDGRVQVTLLARHTQYRRVLNQDNLIETLRRRTDIALKLAQFEHGHDFRLQLRAMADTDVLIGMHGAGLTHTLFLPDWAAVFEMYNCGDENCYKDLARLRGVAYFTWEKKEKLKAQDEGHHPSDGGPHEKFTNYEFDVEEFMSIVDKAVTHVKRNKEWRKYNRVNKRGEREEL